MTDRVTANEVDRRLSMSLETLSCRIGSLDQAIRDMTERMITRVEYEANQKTVDHRLNQTEEDIVSMRNRSWWLAGVAATGVVLPILVGLYLKGG